jgi:hypothetical protein
MEDLELVDISILEHNSGPVIGRVLMDNSRIMYSPVFREIQIFTDDSVLVGDSMLKYNSRRVCSE